MSEQPTKNLHRNYVSLSAILGLTTIASVGIATGRADGMIDAIVVAIAGVLGVHQLSKRT